MAARKTNGQFEKGHSGNPAGRPKRATEEKYLKALSRIVTTKEWEKVVKVALARAKAGDHQARQWLSDNLIGKPVQRTEVTGARGGPVEHKVTSIVQVQVYIPDNGRGDRDPTTTGAAGEIPE